MSTEARIVAPQQKIGARPTGASAAATEDTPAKGGKKKLIMIGGAVGIVVLVAAYWFLAGPGKATSAAAETDAAVTASAEPVYELGDVLTIDSISINLQGGHYLRLGLGLQTIATVHAAPDPAVALDAAIALYSGHTTEELSDPTTREDLKAELGKELLELYHGDVVDVYYTDFVTQ